MWIRRWLVWSVALLAFAGCASKSSPRQHASAEVPVGVRVEVERLGLKEFRSTFERRAAETRLLEGFADTEVVVLAREEMSGNKELSWEQAKRYLYNNLDDQGDYVVCVYGGGQANLVGALGRKRPEASGKMSVEHTWPRRAIWGGIGVNNMPESDLHHLYPAHSSLNSSRGEHYYGTPTREVRVLRLKSDGRLARDGEPGRTTGSRRGKDDEEDVVFEPPPEHRGNAARAIFYISVRYDKSLPDKLEETLRQWHQEDPVDDAEQQRCDEIERIQGNRNLFVDRPELVEVIEDF